MLCLLVKKQLKRRTLKEKLHLCKNNVAHFHRFDTEYGAITVCSLYSYSGMEKAEKRLRRASAYPLYTYKSQNYNEYIKRAVICTALDFLKQNKGKTVFFGLEKPDISLLINLCALSDKLFIPFSLSDAEMQEIYRLCGTLPVFTGLPVVCDLYLDLNLPLKVTLPENLRHICPKEFSPLLFAGLLYKENGRFLL